MPGDRLPFAILVGCEVQLASVREQRLEPLDVLFLVAVDDVEGLEIVVDIDTEARLNGTPVGTLEIDPYAVGMTIGRRLP